MSAPTTEIPGYIAGAWTIDSTHSDVTFTVRHLGVSKVRGRFGDFAGQIVTAAEPADSTVTATIQAGTVDTNSAQRDEHVRGADFLDVEQFPTLSFHTTGIRVDDGDFLVDGELTLHGVTKPVTLQAELGGFGDGLTPDSTVIGVEASTEISRSDFGVGPTIPVAMVSDKIKIELNIEAVLQK